MICPDFGTYLTCHREEHLLSQVTAYLSLGFSGRQSTWDLKQSGHKIFRLGDVVASDALQIFEEVEQAGFKVGAVSPMNAVNRLSAPAYFIPDPWTDTPSDRSIFQPVECLRARSRRRSMIIRSPDSL